MATHPVQVRPPCGAAAQCMRGRSMGGVAQYVWAVQWGGTTSESADELSLAVGDVIRITDQARRARHACVCCVCLRAAARFCAPLRMSAHRCVCLLAARVRRRISDLWHLADCARCRDAAQEGEWWRGVTRDGSSGLFPACYVSLDGSTA